MDRVIEREEALRRAGLELTDQPDAVTVIEEQGRFILRCDAQELATLSTEVSPDDLAAVVRMAVDLADERRRANDAVEERSAALLHASIAAHDINNALCVIFNTLEELERACDGDAVEIARGLGDASRTIAAMAQSVLPRRRATVVPWIDVNATISDVARSLRRLVPSGVQLATKLAPELPPTRIDPVDVDRALINLVRNASRATDPGGTITIATSLVDVGAGGEHDVPRGTWIVIAVEDTGVGMDEDALCGARHALVAADAPRGAHGFGLRSVARITRAAGGHVRLRSAPNAGTKVSLWLPAR